MFSLFSLLLHLSRDVKVVGRVSPRSLPLHTEDRWRSSAAGNTLTRDKFLIQTHLRRPELSLLIWIFLFLFLLLKLITIMPVDELLKHEPRHPLLHFFSQLSSFIFCNLSTVQILNKGIKYKCPINTTSGPRPRYFEIHLLCFCS